jgi:hypothetical protein
MALQTANGMPIEGERDKMQSCKGKEGREAGGENRSKR